MKTVLWTGGSVVLDDDTVDAIRDYSSALAQLRLTGTVTIADRASRSNCAQVELTVGFGASLTVHDSPSTTGERGDRS